MKTCFLIPFLLISSLLFSTEVDTIWSRLYEEYQYKDYFMPDFDTVGAGAMLASQKTDGSWADVDYTVPRIGTEWAPMKHLYRLHTLAAAFIRGGAQDTALKRGTVSALDYWIVNDAAISANNWWYDDIGQQLQLGPVLVLMKKHVDSTRLFAGSRFLRAKDVETQGGQNLLWLAQQRIWRGAVVDSVDLIVNGLTYLKNEIKYSWGDGIQGDLGFYQHGPLLYNGGYGRGFMEDNITWLLSAQGLSFSYDSAKVNLLVSYILDGSQWMIRRNGWDFSCGGREISRSGWGKFHMGYVSKLRKIISPRSAELNAMADHVLGLNDSALTGVKQFVRNDYHVKRHKDFSFSVRMCSKRTLGSEAIDGENQKNYYLPFGANNIMRKGDEYYGIYPIWDWARIPGTTAPHNPSPGATEMMGTTDFVGGVTDGKRGAVGFDYKWDQIYGKKAWFSFDNEVVALGAGINGVGSYPVYTSLNQCNLSGDVWAATDTSSGTQLSTGSRTLDNLRWVFHDSIGYIFPNPTSATIANQQQSGSWRSINGSQSTANVTGDVFSCWLDHGLNPSNSSYTYIVLPGKSREEIKNYSLSIPVKVLINTPDFQAVTHEGLKVTGIVFYSAGTVVVRYGLSVSVDKPCIVLLDESGSKYKVTISNPINTWTTIKVGLQFNGGGAETITFVLPVEQAPGTSMTLMSVASVNIENPESAVRFTFTDSLTGKPISGVKVSMPGVINLDAVSNSSGSAILASDSGKKIFKYEAPLYRTIFDTVQISFRDTLNHPVTMKKLPRSGIIVVPESSLVIVGSTLKLSAFYRYSDGGYDAIDTIKSDLIWSIDKPALASIDSVGNVRSLGLLGASTVTCSSKVDGVTGRASVKFIRRITLTPTDDGFGHSQNPSGSYASSTALVVKGELGNERQSYLKFDLNTLKGSKIISATLKLYPQTLPTSELPIRVCAVDVDTWSENTLTWSNQPAVGSALDTIRLNTEALKYQEWDVTQYTSSQIASDGLVTLCVQDYSEAVGWLSFNSKEFAENRPQLELVIIEDSLPHVSVDGKSGAQTVVERTDFKVEPTPFNPSVNLILSGNLKTGASVRIYNPEGKLVKDLSQNVSGGIATWHAPNNGAGIYLAIVEKGNLKISRKLIYTK
ncbi:MAG: DNRLRE domain-containing protein [Fibrobacteres bacterium]|nr:DNRLRE domain-containing protein [Fibrobacterota bacterium]